MPDNTPPRCFALRGRCGMAIAAAGLLVIGGGAGAVTVAATRPSVTMAPATPVAIRSLSSNGIVTIRGRVAEIYGNKFVMADASGRALVDTGRDGEDGTLVTAGEPVTVQGRFDHGFVRAAFLVGPDSKVTALGPLGGSRHDRHGPHRHGRGPDGPDGDFADGAGAPPPPPGAAAPQPQPGGAAPAAPQAAPQAAPRG